MVSLHLSNLGSGRSYQLEQPYLISQTISSRIWTLVPLQVLFFGTCLSKAFDTVDNPLLLQKLTDIGLTTSTTQWFRSYLTNRSQITSVGDAHSASTEMPIGVPRQYIGTFIVFNLRECSSGLSSGKWYYSLCGRYCTLLLFQKRQWSWTAHQCWLKDSVWVVL